MINLLKTDMMRFLRSKQFIIISIISFAIALFLPLLYAGLQYLMNSTLSSEDPLEVYFSARDFAFSSYGFQFGFTLMGVRSSSVNVVFIITAILFTTIISNEFSYGIIRNKIIAGHKRINIYFSLFITLFVFMFSIAFFSSLLSFAIASVFFPYDASGGKVFADDLLPLIEGVGFGILGYLFFTAFICFFAIGLNKTALAIIFSIVLGFIGMIASTACDAAIMALESVERNATEDFWYNAAILINCLNIHREMSSLNIFSYTIYEVIAYFINPICFTFVYGFFGAFIFLKRDIK